MEGIFPPVITPFKENGEVDYEAFQYNMKKWSKTGLAGFVPLGSNSEFCYLNEEEKLKLIRITAECAEGKIVMAGTGMELADDTVRLTNLAAKAGADCALVITPSFFDSAMSTAALREYYLTVAEESEIPILLYNVPKFTHVTIAAELVGELSDHPNIIGIKDSSGNIALLTSYLEASRGKDFSVLCGTAGVLFPALMVGASGGVCALANCHPDECVSIYQLVREGKYEEACELYKRMLPVNQAVTGTYGIAGLKAACDLKGYQGGFVRKPLQEQSEENKKKIAVILRVQQKYN